MIRLQSASSAGAAILAAAVRSLEHLEDTSLIIGTDADSIVPDRDDPVSVVSVLRTRGRSVLAAVPDGVFEEVLEHLSELMGVAFDTGVTLR